MSEVEAEASIPRIPQRSLLYRRRARVELIVVVSAILAYFGVRAITEGAEQTALQNAETVMRVQELLWLDWDIRLHQWVTQYRAAITPFNWIYMWGHWPVIILSGIWLFTRFPGTYYRTRNAFLVSGGLGFIFFITFPLAPPRLTDLDVVDTVTRFSDSYRFLQPVSLTNQYAAMPSLHFGWNLLIGIALVRTIRPVPLRALAAALPLAMAAAVVITANHFVLDVIVGGCLALFGLYVANWMERSVRGRRVHRYLVPLEQEVEARTVGRRAEERGEEEPVER